MKNCPKCGALLADSAEKCTSCEAPGPRPAAPPVPAPAAVPVRPPAEESRRRKALLLSAVCCGAGQFYKGQVLKSVLLFTVNIIFYPATLLGFIALGDYEHPGALAAWFAVYWKLLCLTGPVWVFGLIDAFEPEEKQE